MLSYCYFVPLYCYYIVLLFQRHCTTEYMPEALHCKITNGYEYANCRLQKEITKTRESSECMPIQIHILCNHKMNVTKSNIFCHYTVTLLLCLSAREWYAQAASDENVNHILICVQGTAPFALQVHID